MNDTRDLNDLYYYVQVVDHGGFSPASRALGIPKSKLSRRIAALEGRLQTRLIQRSTRRFTVTELGQTFYRHCRAMLIEADAAEEAIAMTQAEPSGLVRVTCPLALLNMNVGQMVADFMHRHPKVQVHLIDTNRRVDVIAEGVDLAIRVRPPPLEDSDLVLRVLADRGQCLVAAPELLVTHGLPKHPAELSDWPSLDLGSPLNEHVWNLFGPEGAHAAVRHRPRLITGDMLTLRTAAVTGVGVAQLPHMMVTEQLASGALVPLLSDWAPRREIVHAVYPSRRGQLPAVRALLDHIAETFDTLKAD